jgi:hypothetical protein
MMTYYVLISMSMSTDWLCTQNEPTDTKLMIKCKMELYPLIFWIVNKLLVLRYCLGLCYWSWTFICWALSALTCICNIQLS